MRVYDKLRLKRKELDVKSTEALLELTRESKYKWLAKVLLRMKQSAGALLGYVILFFFLYGLVSFFLTVFSLVYSPIQRR